MHHIERTVKQMRDEAAMGPDGWRISEIRAMRQVHEKHLLEQCKNIVAPVAKAGALQGWIDSRIQAGQREDCKQEALKKQSRTLPHASKKTNKPETDQSLDQATCFDLPSQENASTS